MFRQNFRNQSPGFGHNSDGGFRSPMPRPRYQSSPRFHQQFVPHHSGPPPPNPLNMALAMSMQPYASPQQGGRSPCAPSPRAHISSPPPLCSSFESSAGTPGGVYHSPRRHGSPASHENRSWTSDSCVSTPSTGSEREHSRGSNRFKNGPSPWRDRDANPGGSTDIRQYFNPSMLADPWQHLTSSPRVNGSGC